MDEGRLMQSMLLDFYGELLTEKQRMCYELYYNMDLSLSEIAEQNGISRQGAWDNIHRAEASLREVEEKTGLIRRFSETRQRLKALREQLCELCSMTEGSARDTAVRALGHVDALMADGSDRG